MKEQLVRIKETLIKPSIIKRSNTDEKVWLYYRFYENTPVTEKYLLVVVKHENNDSFILTALYTDKIKKGDIIWEE
ncbi:MAG: hypothetical protein ACE5KE_08355 [Methanosarcinales archaeon]